MEQDPAPKKGFFSRVTDALFEEVPGANSLPPATDTGEKVEPPEALPPALQGRLSEEDENLLRDILADVRHSGPLLSQFIELAESLRDIIPQEPASFQAAMKALEKTAGVNKEQLLEAAEEQIKALAAERQDFEQSAGKMKESLQGTTKKAAEIRARIDEMQGLIAALEKEEQQLFNQMAAEEQLIRTAQLRFNGVIRVVESDIRGNLDKIRSFLPDETAPGGDGGKK